VIALHPALYGREHRDHFFAADLHAAGISVVRRAVNPRGLHEVLPAEQQPRTLRAAQAFASAVGDERRAILEVHVGNGENFRGRVDENRHAAAVRRFRDRARAERACVGLGPGEDVDHRRARAECRLELLARAHLDDADAGRTDGGVVDVARVARDDHFVSRKSLKVRNAHVKIGIAASEAGGGRMRERRGASTRDHPPFRLRQLREPRADCRHQLVEVHVMP
jgi:hypothetical protein